MAVARSADAEALLTELIRMQAAMPLPNESWHPFVAQIRACHADFGRALAIAAEHPAVLEQALALLEEEAPPLRLAAPASSALAAAAARLAALPRPEGQHPYLDELLPALQGAELLLAAISLVPAAAAGF